MAKDDILKMIYEQHHERLRFEMEFVYKTMAAFTTLEFALAAWTTLQHPLSLKIKIALFTVNSILAFCVGFIITKNYAGRDAFLDTLDNVQKELDITNVIVESKSKSSQGIWYCIITCLALGQAFILFAG